LILDITAIGLKNLHLSSPEYDVLEATFCRRHRTQRKFTSTENRPPAHDVTSVSCFIHRLRSVPAV